jgi:hypothetical protein
MALPLYTLYVHLRLKKLNGRLLVQVVEGVRVFLDDVDAEFSAHRLHVVVPDVAERLRVRLERQVGDAPTL